MQRALLAIDTPLVQHGSSSPLMQHGPSSPLTQHSPSSPLKTGFALSRHRTPVTPTPKRDPGGRALLRSPISMQEFTAKKASRDDDMFQDYKLLLRSATSLATFEWDAANSKGVLVPIP